MPTIEQQLTELVNQKNALANNLNTKGVTASTSETLNTLVPKVLEISGGGNSGGKYLVQVIDYDGTVLKSDHLDTGATFTLPDSPTNHPKLVFQEWSSPVTISNNSITVGNSDITIGAVYKTVSGLTEFDIELTKATGLEVYCRITGNKNWGDGTVDDDTAHTYVEYGKYTITCDGTSIDITPGGIFSNTTTSTPSPNYYCKEIRIGENVITIGSNAFQSCYSLTSISIPNGVTQIWDGTFKDCYSLKCVIIPTSVTLSGFFKFLYIQCSTLISIVLPHTLTAIGSNSFQNCNALKNISIPSSVTSIGSYAFSGCNSIKSLIIPNGVITINTETFYNCHSIIKYDFTNHTIIPAMSIGNAFANINEICKIYVPDALYDDWIAATNWVTYADYIYKASEMEG